MPNGDTYAFCSNKLSTVMGLSWNVNSNNYTLKTERSGDGTVPARSVYDLKGFSDDTTGAPTNPHNAEEGF